MKKNGALMLLFFGFCLIIGTLQVGPVSACSTVLAGKDATKDGSVLLGHNEDNGGVCNTLQWRVPRQYHSKGEVVHLKRGGTLAQVEMTYAYIWSENVGLEWSDGGINEFGVTVGSNWAGSRVQPEDAELTDGGIGYMLRHLILQRAGSAREGVEIATQLVSRFGYAHPGRSYQIADPKEAWVLHVIRGKHFVAERVPDDEVYFVPNVYVIHDVDFDDHENFIVSPGLKEYAIAYGWYEPSDAFDFAKIFADQESLVANSNTYRQRGAQFLLTGKEPVFLEGEWKLPFAVKPNRKIGVEDVAQILRYHYEGSSLSSNEGYLDGSPHGTGERKICVSNTNTSFIAQLRDGMPREIGCIYWLATGSPCTSVYVPWYLGMTTLPEQWHMAKETPFNTQRSFLDYHFEPTEYRLRFNADSAYYTFCALEYLIESNYKEEIGEVQKNWKAMEEREFALQPEIEATMLRLFDTDKELAMEYVTQYSTFVSLEALSKAHVMLNNVQTKYMTH
jgi:dipeptidase